MKERIIEKIDTDTYNRISNTLAAVSFCSFLAGQALSHSYVDASFLSYALSVFGYYEVLSLYSNILTNPFIKFPIDDTADIALLK